MSPRAWQWCAVRPGGFAGHIVVIPGPGACAHFLRCFHKYMQVVLPFSAHYINIYTVKSEALLQLDLGTQAGFIKPAFLTRVTSERGARAAAPLHTTSLHTSIFPPQESSPAPPGRRNAFPLAKCPA